MGMVFSIFCLVISLLVLPGAYIALCLQMSARKVERPPYLAAFVLFGNVGGWVLAFGLSPSGLAASCIVFLVFIAFPALMLSSIILLCRKNRSWLQDTVMMGGFMFPIAMGFVFALVYLLAALFGST